MATQVVLGQPARAAIFLVAFLDDGPRTPAAAG